jgi:thiamine pyrophosphate-dependent acetolactate synthase large subunit-like protein
MVTELKKVFEHALKMDRPVLIALLIDKYGH